MRRSSSYTFAENPVPGSSLMGNMCSLPKKNRDGVHTENAGRRVNPPPTSRERKNSSADTSLLISLSSFHGHRRKDWWKWYSHSCTRNPKAESRKPKGGHWTPTLLVSLKCGDHSPTSTPSSTSEQEVAAWRSHLPVSFRKSTSWQRISAPLPSIAQERMRNVTG